MISTWLVKTWHGADLRTTLRLSLSLLILFEVEKAWARQHNIDIEVCFRKMDHSRWEATLASQLLGQFFLRKLRDIDIVVANWMFTGSMALPTERRHFLFGLRFISQSKWMIHSPFPYFHLSSCSAAAAVAASAVALIFKGWADATSPSCAFGFFFFKLHVSFALIYLLGIESYQTRSRTYQICCRPSHFLKTIHPKAVPVWIQRSI